MTMTPGLRKFALTLHVIVSVGWFGSVAAFLALAIAGLTVEDVQLIRAVYDGMLPITQYVIVPFGIASLLTGVISSLGTEWGLFRHYWLVIKFVITVLSTIGLLVHLKPIHYLAALAANSKLSSADVQTQVQLVIISSAALLALIAATTLSVYKPRGLTRYGWRKLQERRQASQQS